MLEYLEIGDLVLENGTIIRNVKIAYNVYGNIENAEKIIWICHASQPILMQKLGGQK
jgi:homoserine acetyltransferase